MAKVGGVKILIRKRAVPSGNKAVKQQKLQSSRWNKRPLRVPFSTAPQWRSVEPSKVNPSTRLLPSGRGNNIHFYKKHRRVDPIHFTWAAALRQPNQEIQPNHLSSGERGHSTKDTNQSKPVRPAQPPNLTHWARELKNEQDISFMAAAGPA